MLKVRNVSMKYPEFSLENISFELEKGYVLGIVGANGAGKTTLIKLITKELHDFNGEIRLDNKIEYRDVLAYVPSEKPFDNSMRIKTIANFYENIYPSFDKGEFFKKLNEFDINIKSLLKNLSLGRKQKMMLALVLSLSAKLIVLDEPTDGIDIFVRADIVNSLSEYLYDNDAILIIASHQLEQFEDILDYILYLEDGRTLFYTDIIDFKKIANNYLVNEISDITLKDFVYAREKERLYVTDKRG